jgi:hypothetical protein
MGSEAIASFKKADKMIFGEKGELRYGLKIDVFTEIFVDKTSGCG